VVGPVRWSGYVRNGPLTRKIESSSGVLVGTVTENVIAFGDGVGVGVGTPGRYVGVGVAVGVAGEQATISINAATGTSLIVRSIGITPSPHGSSSRQNLPKLAGGGTGV
jgi:hypothetical protein